MADNRTRSESDRPDADALDDSQPSRSVCVSSRTGRLILAETGLPPRAKIEAKAEAEAEAKAEVEAEAVAEAEKDGGDG